MNINDLPPELLIHIISYVSSHDFDNMRKVCLLWAKLSTLPVLCRNISCIKNGYETVETLEHICRIQNSIHLLTITINYLQELHKFDESITFSNLKRLAIIDTSEEQNGVTDSCLKVITVMAPNITEITLPYQYEVINIALLAKLKLEAVVFENTVKDDDILISFLVSQPRLEKLSINGNLQSYTIQKIINDFPQLKSICFGGEIGTEIENKTFLSSTFPLPLTELSFACSSYINDRGLLALSERAKSLIKLNMVNCKKITDKGLVELAKLCPLLEELSVGCRIKFKIKITDKGILAIAEGCPRLNNFTIENCGVSDIGLIQIARSCYRMKCITIIGSDLVTDETLEALAQNCSVLEEAKFNECDDITISGVISLIKSCRLLRVLDLQSCQSLSDISTSLYVEIVTKKVIQKMMNETFAPDVNNHNVEICNHSHLQTLLLDWCFKITKKSVMVLTNLCPDLRKVTLTECIRNFGDDDFVTCVFENCVFLDHLRVFNRNLYRNFYTAS